MDMAAIGGFDESGVNRQAFSTEDRLARGLMQTWARQLGLEVLVDRIGNLFFRYEPAGVSGDPVVTGSHADSQPTGGRFDGIYGVVAGFEAIEAIKKSEANVSRPIEVVAWSNEEGSRFAPGAMGSTVFTGRRELIEFLDVVDCDGVLLRDALNPTLDVSKGAAPREFRHPLAAYVELHVEQGPVLEAQGKDIGVVTDIQGCRWFKVEVSGEARHAGSTPPSVRRDAMQAAHRIISSLNRHFDDPSDVTRYTIGRFELRPNSQNTIAEYAAFTVDFRHPDEQVLRRKGDAIGVLAQEAAGACDVSIKETFNNAPVRFPGSIVNNIASVTERQGMSHTMLPSGAFHDAMFLAAHCPTGMIFVPSRDGISHHPDEYTSPRQLARGARVLSETLVELANDSGD